MTMRSRDDLAVSAEDLGLYLMANQWSQVETVNEYLGIWSHQGTERELFVPRTSRVADFGDQLEIIVQCLASLEQRSPRQVIWDMQHTSADIIRIRIDTPAVDRGTIAFEKAAQVIEETRSMLIAAARAAIHPQNFFTSRPPVEVSDYLQSTLLGQTEPGSFIFTIVSPIIAPPITAPDEEKKTPFSRRVTDMLSRSLSAVRSAASEVVRPLTSVFEDIVDEGVSSNLCEALYVISEQSFDHAVEVEFSWSAKISASTDAKRTRIVVPAIITPSLQAMASHLKAIALESGFEVVGRVERLSNQEASEGFDLAIRAAVQGRERLVALELSGDAREVASEAWTTHKPVRTVGTLDRRYRPYRLLNPDRFEILDL